jgi:hypothetical protein
MATARVLMHKITETKVVRLDDGQYGINFAFNDGLTDFAEVGDKQMAEWYASVQLGEKLPLGVYPTLLNAKKAEELRRFTTPAPPARSHSAIARTGVSASARKTAERTKRSAPGRSRRASRSSR